MQCLLFNLLFDLMQNVMQDLSMKQDSNLHALCEGRSFE